MAVSRSKTANSLLWSGVESSGLSIISFISLIVYSRILSATDFGLFSIVMALVELLAVLVGMLFHDALVQRQNVTDLHFDTAFTFTLGSSVAMVLGCWALAPAFAATVHQPEAAGVLQWMSLSFPFSGVSGILLARARRQFSFRSVALRSLIGRVIGGGIGIAAAFMGWGLWSLVLQQILMGLIGALVLWVTCDKLPRLRFGISEFKQLVAFGIFAVGGLFLGFSVKRLFTILAGSLLGAEAAGYLNLSFRTIDMFWAISATALSQVSLPMLAGLQSEPARFKRAYQKAIEYGCLALYPCFVGIGVISPEVVEVLFGKQWLSIAPYVTALGFLVLVQAPMLFVTPVLTAVGRPRDPLVNILWKLVFMLVVVWVSRVPSLPWAIGIWVASECMGSPVGCWMLWRATKFTFIDQVRGVSLPFLASMTMAVALVVARHVIPAHFGPAHFGQALRLMFLVPSGAAVFVGAMLVLDRSLLNEFLGFVCIAFEKKWPNAKAEDAGV
jgi:O-antigen/teichoic acid export membrane protein